MNISITNTSAAVSQSENLIQHAAEISGVKEAVDGIMAELSEYWAATQQDQQTFYKGLEKGNAVLGNIVECNKDFGNAVIDYAEVMSTTSQNSVTP